MADDSDFEEDTNSNHLGLKNSSIAHESFHQHATHLRGHGPTYRRLG